MNETISKDTLEFLKTLEQNNHRDWFNDHKTEFQNIETHVKKVYNLVFENLKNHDDVDAFKMYRIYRDVRFSKDKTPYKTHFGGSFHRSKPQLRGGYYLQIQPKNESFIAVGFWEPSPADLLRIRKEFEMEDQDIRAIMNDKAFKNIWGEFVGDEVKSAPKGFNKDHKAIDLIKKKQYIFIKTYTDEQVLSPDFLNDVNDSFKAIRPYLNYMSEVLTSDLNGVSII